MDPYAVLGVRPGSPESEIAAAYREQAKRWHPDRTGSAGEERMAEINVAYDVLRAGAQHTYRPEERRPGLGGWLADAIRRALGPELLEALYPGEEIRLVTPASTWASPARHPGADRAPLPVAAGRRAGGARAHAPIARRRRDRAPHPAQADLADRPHPHGAPPRLP